LSPERPHRAQRANLHLQREHRHPAQHQQPDLLTNGCSIQLCKVSVRYLTAAGLIEALQQRLKVEGR
jgi:hypothetical protein